MTVGVLLIFSLCYSGQEAAQKAGQPADDAKAMSMFGRRYDAFRSLFAFRGVQTGTLAEWNEADFGEVKHWVVVQLGDTSKIVEPKDGWRRFVDFGGRLMVATDLGRWRNSVDSFQLDFDAGPVKVEALAQAVGGHLDCPLVLDFEDESYPLFRGVGGIGLNRSGWLSLGRTIRWQTAVLPVTSLGPRGQDVSGLPVVAAAPIGNGRLLVAADHSIFINEMMWDPAGQPLNLRFASNTVDWLLEGIEPDKARVLFFEDGQLITDWVDPRFEKGDWPASLWQEQLQATDRLLRAANRALLKQQAKRDPTTGRTLYNQAVRNFENSFPELYFWRWACMAAVGLAALLMVWWLWRSRVPPGSRTVRLTPGNRPSETPRDALTAAFIDPRPERLHDRMRQEILEDGHYVEIARRLSRYWLEQQLGTPISSAPRDIVLPTGTRSARRLRRRWFEAWALATEAPHPPMTLVQFNQFKRDLSELETVVTNILP